MPIEWSGYETRIYVLLNFVAGESPRCISRESGLSLFIWTAEECAVLCRGKGSGQVIICVWSCDHKCGHVIRSVCVWGGGGVM